MILKLTLPAINELLMVTRVLAIHAPEGAQVPVGGKLLDILLSAGDALEQDCPLESRFCLSARDGVWVRRWLVREGEELGAGAALGLFSTEADEPIDGEPARQLRLSVAGVVADFDDWDGWK